MGKKGRGKKQKTDDGREVICKNRRAERDYDLGDVIEAGIVLKGTEVKSCRAGRANLSDAYVMIHNKEAYLVGSHIAEYDKASYLNHDPDRKRKLLLHRRQIARLAIKIRERGLAAIPLSMYFKNGHVKVELGLGKGRTHEDRRQLVKDREVERELRRIMRGRNR